MKKQTRKLLCSLLLSIAVAISCMAPAAGLSITQKENRTQSVAAFAMKEPIPYSSVHTVPTGLPVFTREELAELITAVHMQIINDKRAKEKGKK